MCYLTAFVAVWLGGEYTNTSCRGGPGNPSSSQNAFLRRGWTRGDALSGKASGEQRLIYITEMAFANPSRLAQWHAHYLRNIANLQTVPGFLASSP